jgi:glycosyltransferase involved in cell wall biosynthesis
MRSVHQLVHTLSYGDAISTEVLALQRVLQSLGFKSEVFAIHEHPLLKGRSRSYRELLVDAPDRADIILHYSLGSPLNQLYSNWRSGERILVYHNITPARWYRAVNQRVADDIEVGLRDLPQLCALSSRIWADSAFNAGELASLGFSNCEVLDLLVDPARWEGGRNEGLYASIKGAVGAQVLHVGRLAPNKCLEDLIKSFYFFVKYIDTDARLRLVGIDTDTELYSFSLRELASYLGIAHAVEFVGPRSDSEVRAMYEASDVYLCMSEHEGFCLPLIEAMHFKLPVIAYAAGAVPDTLGDGGILIYEKRYAEVGALIAEVARPGELQSELISKGSERVSYFSFERFSARVSELMGRGSDVVVGGGHLSCGGR